MSARTTTTSRNSFFILALLPCMAFGQTKLQKRVGPKVDDAGSACDTAAWQLVFHDEFDGTALDRTKWITYYPYSADGSDRCESCRYMGGTNCVYTDDQVKVANGLLQLGVEAKPATWYGKTAEHEASMIRSIGSAEFSFARFEIRCKLPEGEGLWPAFWMFGGETEIDVFEVCAEKPRWVKASLHQWGKLKYSNTGKFKGEDTRADFHTYAVEWEADEIRWYMDDELINSRGRFVDVTGKPLPGCEREAGSHNLAPYYPRAVDKVNVIAGNGVSEYNGFCKGPKAPKPWPKTSSMLVDWIRVYQRKPQPDLSNLCDRARTMRATHEGELRNGGTAEIHIDGPHGPLEWNVGAGLAILGRHEHGITVKASGTNGPTWVIAYCSDDPCSHRPTSFEIEVEADR